MKVYYKPGISTIQFRIDLKDPELLDKATFTYLVTMREGGEQDASVFGLGDHDAFIDIDIRFDYDKFSDARAHCQRNLTKDNSIKSDYLGALERADPGRVMTVRILGEAGLTTF
jgi:hypothetical protein